MAKKSAFWKYHNEAEKAFRKTTDFKRLAYIGLGAFEELQTGGMQRRVEENQSEWRPLDNYYRRRKAWSGYSQEMYVMTGRLAKALNYMPEKVGKKQGVKYAVSKTYVARIEYDLRVKGKKAHRAFGRLNYMRPLIYWDNNSGTEMTPHIAKRIEHVFSQEGLGTLSTFKAGR